MKFLDLHSHHIKPENVIFSLKSEFEVPDSGYFSVGLHPWFLKEDWRENVKQILEIAKNPRCLAIGESGFDRLKGPEILVQKEAFQFQAELAFDLNMPLILHCVKGHDLLLEFLKREKNLPNIIWHGFNQNPRLAIQLLDFPVSFSFGKALLNPDSNAASWLKSCPLDRIFLETDDSGLEIYSIYQAASLLLQLSEEDLGNLVKENWNRISNRKME